MKYGLIGFPLSHSFSKVLHEKFGNKDYELNELREDEVDKFMRDKDFLGINVTIPYKQTVIKYLDYIDENAKEINAVNTIKNVNGKLYGYNTDALGFEALLDHNDIVVLNKNILILGTGATSKTVECVLKKLNAKSIVKRNRNNEYIEVYKHCDNYKNVEVIINTTPNGMYPHMDDEVLVDLKNFDKLEAVVDVIYNPLRTKLLQQAEDRGLKIAGGLFMLVAQGYFADQIFNKKDVAEITVGANSTTVGANSTTVGANEATVGANACGARSQLLNTYNNLLSTKQNIVLIGMPSCGKSTIGKMLAERLNKKYIDTDSEIEKQINDKISNYIINNGEAKFREIEKQVVREVSSLQGVIISTGGGVVLDNDNVVNLKYNGRLFFINRSIEKLKATSSRPLTATIEQLKQKYDERLPIYKKACDIEINGDLEFDEKLKIIENMLNLP